MLRHCAELLLRHVRREEDGVFAALKGEGEFVEEIEALEAEHVDLDERLAALDADTPDLKGAVEAFLADLALHIDREDLGIFPVSVVSLGSRGWTVVERVHEEQPSFLHR
jgi:iron-sulfur cluster repair protein YtfE (RIC family)